MGSSCYFEHGETFLQPDDALSRESQNKVGFMIPSRGKPSRERGHDAASLQSTIPVKPPGGQDPPWSHRHT